jgi:hypothetical protein
MLGSSVLFVPGLVILTFGVAVHAAATGAVKTVKMSAKLVAADLRTHSAPAAPAGGPAVTEARPRATRSPS